MFLVPAASVLYFSSAVFCAIFACGGSDRVSKKLMQNCHPVFGYCCEQWLISAVTILIVCHIHQTLDFVVLEHFFIPNSHT